MPLKLSRPKNLKPLLQQKGWWGYKDIKDPVTGKTKTVKLSSPRRLRTIYETNKRTAYSAEQWQRIQQTKDSHPYLLYQLGSSAEHRLEHLGFNQLLLPVDDPFLADTSTKWLGLQMPCSFSKQGGISATKRP